MKFFLSLTLILILFSCDEMDHRLHIKNKLSFDAYFVWHDNNSLTDYTNQRLDLQAFFIPKDSAKMMFMFGKQGWPSFVRTSRNKKLNIFVIPADTMDKYPKDTIIKYKMYFKYESYSLQELESMEWTIEMR